MHFPTKGAQQSVSMCDILLATRIIEIGAKQVTLYETCTSADSVQVCALFYSSFDY